MLYLIHWSVYMNTLVTLNLLPLGITIFFMFQGIVPHFQCQSCFSGQSMIIYWYLMDKGLSIFWVLDSRKHRPASLKNMYQTQYMNDRVFGFISPATLFSLHLPGTFWQYTKFWKFIPPLLILFWKNLILAIGIWWCWSTRTEYSISTAEIDDSVHNILKWYW